MSDFNPGQTYLAHKARCDAVQRRGHQQRLQKVIHSLTVVGVEHLFDNERETLAVVQQELTKVEALMLDAGQEP